jgi:hypothetical protein
MAKDKAINMLCTLIIVFFLSEIRLEFVAGLIQAKLNCGRVLIRLPGKLQFVDTDRQRRQTERCRTLD